MQMPIEFEIFENFCTHHGYKAVDQRKETGSGNIYYVKTRNGVKVEIKAKKKVVKRKNNKLKIINEINSQ